MNASATVSEHLIALIIERMAMLTVESLCYIEERSSEIVEDINRCDKESLDEIATMIMGPKRNKIENEIKTLQKKLDDDVNRKGIKYHLPKGEKRRTIRRINKLENRLKEIS